MTDASCELRAFHWRLSALYAGTFVALVACTWPLWSGSSEFPRAPAFGGLTSVSRPVDLAVLLVSAAAAIIGTATTRRWPPFWLAATGFVLVSFALDQHRLQVWAYHLSLAGLVATFSTPQRAIPRLRWLTICIYAWSAVSKLDVGFVAGPGRTLLRGLTSAFTINPPAGTFEQYAPWLMPLGEMLTALALAVPHWRRVGLWLSIAMHLLLLLAVGPLGLGHEIGVQLWNGLFLVQNVMLFRDRPVKGGRSAAEPHPASDGPRPRSALRQWFMRSPRDFHDSPSSLWTDRSMSILLAIVIAMPAVQPWGYWDVWPSWAVYSARGGWTTSFVHHDDISKLPAEAQPFVGEPAPLSDWHPIDIDAWSLSELHCPVYPQPRFRLAVAAALSRSARIRVERRSPPNRFTGVTTLETFVVAEGRLPPEIAAPFWLNTTPRANP